MLVSLFKGHYSMQIFRLKLFIIQQGNFVFKCSLYVFKPTETTPVNTQQTRLRV